jgi:hypothetical protein
MILFLGFLAEGKRGGEVYTSKFLSFLVSRFPDVIPRQMVFSGMPSIITAE